MTVAADYQNEIYRDGLDGGTPILPTGMAALERLAQERLDSRAFGYVAGSAGTESTARANLEAFGRRRIVPRMLRDVAVRDLSVELFGRRLRSPLLLGPVGVLTIMHPEGELAVARAAAAEQVPMILSTASSHSIEQVAQAGGEGPRWYQLYWPNDRDLAASFVQRAHDSGYEALVVTLDTHTLGWRPRDLDQAYLPFLYGIGVANYFTDPVFQKLVGDPIGETNRDRAIAIWARLFGDPSLTWDDLPFLRERWQGPIVLKGIQHPDDARRAADAGMDGVVVSNHGGRQVDGAAGALDALPAVAEAVGDRLTVLFDSGIRSGSDVIKALALGAKAVLLGRPYAYGLGLAGQAGVRHVIRCLLADLDITMATSGNARVADLSPDLLTTAPGH
ncbi:lactate 2-monooxygenase [Nonomuraea jiangxiensis]|uniref:L-lactate dehydrogenase (Cytochrome) n=1 Tax=Nonomuraea jiangxiensis TaxID=633440 RepID=A0A1G9A0T4_9ACTN|nr:lactate 2-monooxygenase [Nonomuraea jiangxiensis]SDK20972.1 L-lactate dehydrogenase (cytochrome) [Nonomuraea jiangxiensis]